MSTSTMPSAVQELTGDYELDPAHSRLGFVVRYAMVANVRGRFGDFEGRLHLDTNEPARSVAEVRISVGSIDTGNPDRDAHLCSADFFDAETHPEMVFRSTRLERIHGQTYRMTGDLTIRGAAHPVTLELGYAGSARDPFGNLRVGFTVTGEINRRDWGLTFNAPLETGGVLIGERIALELDVSAIKHDSATKH